MFLVCDSANRVHLWLIEFYRNDSESLFLHRGFRWCGAGVPDCSASARLDVADAHRFIESRKAKGKVLLIP